MLRLCWPGEGKPLGHGEEQFMFCSDPMLVIR